MVNIFCTRKLESFVSTEERTLESYTSDNNWNAQLISIDRRKCLYFLHKRTLYSFLILNVVKKELAQLDKLFFDGLLAQLKLNDLYKPELHPYLLETYSDLKLFKTDNDQSTLGTMRDDLMHLLSFIDNKPNKFIACQEYGKRRLNSIPLGSRKYCFSKELMELELKNFLPQQKP